jgi:hypothetical protein
VASGDLNWGAYGTEKKGGLGGVAPQLALNLKITSHLVLSIKTKSINNSQPIKQSDQMVCRQTRLLTVSLLSSSHLGGLSVSRDVSDF